ncbi:hypothetical protein HHK36_002288 [Tetracentron sinense]|uniref:Coiled-coil domain-containing protein 22 homolog n=1 Tax=Tetracentron sinense TaxID=13715 RepID=A0A835DSE3_TETSI|nr:hypothetical protein HHK36_002288 [Tetracentron sinense]
MEEAQEILLNSLKNSGVSLPTGVSSIQDLTPGALVSICAQSLHLIDDSLSLPTLFPDSMAERFKFSTEIASAIKNLGYRGDLSFHQFLYPSEEDSYKLVRFLVEILSESGKVAGKQEIRARFNAKEDECKRDLKDWTEKVDNPGVGLNDQTVRTRLNEMKLTTEMPNSSHNKAEEAFLNGALVDPSFPGQRNEPAFADVSRSGNLESSRKDDIRSAEYVEESMKESEDSRRDASGDEEGATQKNDNVAEVVQKLASLRERSSKIRNNIENLQSQEKMLMEEVTAKTLESQHLEDEHELLKAAVEMAFDDQHPLDIYIEQLNERVKAGKGNLVDLELQWDALRKPLEEKRRSLEESLHAKKLQVQEEPQKVKEILLETETIISEIQKREDEHSKLSAELKNQPKIAPRKSYIQRISEIAKNSRKQDADIERILQETRELQIESNSIQDRLHRTYAVVDETVFRDAKKDPVRQQAYRLLTSIHERFEQISEKILATDRTQREAAEQEAKLAAMASRSLNVNKLQADLDAIKMENEFLEQHHFQNN